MWEIIEKILGRLTWVYSQIKPTTLTFVRRDIKIHAGHLEYTFIYRVKKGKWSRSLSKKNISIPVGTDIDLVDIEILTPGVLESKKVRVSELKGSVYEALSTHLESLKDGEELPVTILKPLNTGEFIERKTVKTTPREEEIIFKNLLPYSIEQAEIWLDISEPYPIKSVEIIKHDEDIGQNKYLKLVTKSVQDIKISDINIEFSEGISTSGLLDLAEKSSQMRILLDFEEHEEVRIIIHR